MTQEQYDEIYSRVSLHFQDQNSDTIAAILKIALRCVLEYDAVVNERPYQVHD